MSNNLFVAFDVHDTSREASLILSAIEELGQAVRIFSNVWYVRSNLPAAEAARRVWDIMQPADSLLVIDASGEEAATFNLDDGQQRMLARWHLDLQPPELRRPAETTVTPLRRLEPKTRDRDRAS
jgi:hypothetical protein